jgi:hypothetical protein
MEAERSRNQEASMLFEDIVDRIIRARSQVLHADRVLAQWSNLRPGESPDTNEYVLLVNLIKQASENLDSVVSKVVKKSSGAEKPPAAARSGTARRSAAHRSRPS